MPLSPLDQWKSDHPELLAENSKYKAKLTFTERCEALAAYKAGVERPIIAATYGINISTLNFIIQPQSKSYKDVRREYNDYGHDRFIEKYLTPSALERIAKGGHDWKATLPAKDFDEVKQNLSTTGKPDPRAKRYEGRHTMTWMGAGTVYVAVTYIDADLPALPEAGYDAPREPGWYVYVDSKSPAFADWMHEGPHGQNEDRRTSSSAYNGFAKLIGHDEIAKED